MILKKILHETNENFDIIAKIMSPRLLCYVINIGSEIAHKIDKVEVMKKCEIKASLIEILRSG